MSLAVYHDNVFQARATETANKATLKLDKLDLELMPTARTLYNLVFNRNLIFISIIATVLASIFLPHLSLSFRTSRSLPFASLKSSIPHLRSYTTPRASHNMAYEKEQKVAIAAVLKACDVAQATFQKLVNDETVTKKDKSPVTGKPASQTRTVSA